MNIKTRKKGFWVWAALLAAAVSIMAASFFPEFVERYYTYGIYPYISRVQRVALGWIPFSIGDFFYASIIVFLIVKLVKFLRNFRYISFTKRTIVLFLKKAIFMLLIIYVVFYGLWGLNYSRVGIAGQLELKDEKFSVHDLDTLVGLLHHRLNVQADLLKPAMRDSFRRHKNLFDGAEKAFEAIETEYPFLRYRSPSIKPSVFSYLGNYLGFQGYYNPFSGEAQVNTTSPQSVEPFVAIHEIAHQLGYAKESEANFVAFLACRKHPSTVFVYSVYFDMYLYSIKELRGRDSARAAFYDSTVHRQVKKDIKDYRDFYKKYKNPIEPIIAWGYDYFLRANNQPSGGRSYNEVVNWMIAYFKKFGREAV